MNRINEIGDTKKGQEMLGRTAERAYQRAQRTSGADKKRFMRTYNNAYKTGGKSSNKHLGGSREHFDNGRDYEYEKWADEHNGNVTESKNMNKKFIRLTESDLHKIVKESAKRIMKEVALKGKSGKTYSLHGNDEESWDIMTNLRQNQKGGHGVTQYNTSRNAKNAEEMDAKNHPNRRSLNNANRVKASLKRTSDASKDIMAANEPKLSRIVKESVNRVLTELDWKTYANAARKRALQGADDKVIGDLDAAANKGLEKYDIGSEQPLYGYKNAPRLKTTKQDSWGNKFARQELKMPEHERYSDNYSAYDHGTGFDGTADISLSKIGGNRDARKDIGDYFRGNSKYIKGQGWQ